MKSPCSVYGNPLESVTLDPWRKPNSRRAIRRGSAIGWLRGHVSRPPFRSTDSDMWLRWSAESRWTPSQHSGNFTW